MKKLILLFNLLILGFVYSNQVMAQTPWIADSTNVQMNTKVLESSATGCIVYFKCDSVYEVDLFTGLSEAIGLGSYCDLTLIRNESVLDPYNLDKNLGRV